jgi:hypothetical protein
LCYQLIIHACSNTDLRKLISIKFSSVFLVFQCGASGRTSGPDGTLLESGLGWSPHVRTRSDGVRTRAVIIVRTSLYIVRTRATSLLLFEATSIRTSSTHRPDGDPTEAINIPACRILTLPHKISLLAGCEFLFCEFLAFCIFLIFQVLCFSPYLFSFF